MLTALEVRNFRAFPHQRIALGRITVLLGPNNAGKSALISALPLLSQTLKSPDPDISLLLRGAYEDFGTFRDLVWENDCRHPIGIRLEFTRRPRPRSQGGLFHEGDPTELQARSRTDAALDLTFAYRQRLRETILRDCLFEIPVGTKWFHSRYSPKTGQQVVHYFKGSVPAEQRASISKRLRFLHVLPQVGMLDRDTSARVGSMNRLIWRHSTELRDLEFLGPIRAEPSRTYLFSGESPSSVGRTGERAVDILAADEARRGRKRLDICTMVSGWMHRCGIAERVSIKPLTDRHFEVRIQHQNSPRAQNLADAGYGCSQVLPVLVAGYNLSSTTRRGSLLVVQQPEIHLHPKAEAELADFFVERAEEGIQSIIETHSENFVIRLRRHVASGRVTVPSDVAVYYVFVDEHGRSRAQLFPLNRQGIFEQEWPGGFFPERLEEARQLSLAGARAHEEGPG